jgi:hypothetical protein
MIIYPKRNKAFIKLIAGIDVRKLGSVRKVFRANFTLYVPLDKFSSKKKTDKRVSDYFGVHS